MRRRQRTLRRSSSSTQQPTSGTHAAVGAPCAEAVGADSVVAGSWLPACMHSDKTILVWELERSEGNYGYAKRALKGHSHFVQDVVISSDGQFCLSGSWCVGGPGWKACMCMHLHGPLADMGSGW